jgi:tRNA pseudouridine38-40 synthase
VADGNTINVRLNVSYDGTRYFGFQIQNNSSNTTVQQQIQNALNKIYKEKIVIRYASRTDSGTHAKGQTVNYLTNVNIPTDKIVLAINRLLPDDIKIVTAKIENINFDARRNAKYKIYIYRILNKEKISPFGYRYYYYCPCNLNVKKMKKVSKLMLNKCDFSYLTTSKDMRENKNINLKYIKIIIMNGFVNIILKSTHFFHKMVRFIVGMLLAVGQNKYTLEDVNNILSGRKNFTRKYLEVVPAKGLFLKRVIY